MGTFALTGEQTEGVKRLAEKLWKDGGRNPKGVDPEFIRGATEMAEHMLRRLRVLVDGEQ